MSSRSDRSQRQAAAVHACSFCNRHYSRRDALQRHEKSCPERGLQPLSTVARQRGRKRHSCKRCAEKKLYCDGTSPCGTCASKSATCSNPVVCSSGTSRASSQVREGRVQRRCSTAFLLRDGEEEVFSARFNFPRGPSAQGTAADDEMISMGVDFEFIGSIFDPAFFSVDSWPGAASLEDHFLSANTDKSTTVHMKDYGLTSVTRRLELLPHAIMEGSHFTRRLSPDAGVEALSSLEHIFAPANVATHLANYFQSWHRNCRVIHESTFTAEGVSDALLVAMVLLGAMYSSYDSERRIASKIMLFAEDYIFGKAASTVAEYADDGDDRSTMAAFQIIQASFCMIVTQFWSGDATSKLRAMNCRFSELIDLCHAFGLLQASHKPEDRISEQTWLYKEAQIRTATYLILLDCAFLFFRGIPARVMSSEIDCDLPCDDALFDAKHPFTMQQFKFKRNNNARRAFKGLFSKDHIDPEPTLMLDTFILIHLLYRYVNDALSIELCVPSTDCSVDSLANIRHALDLWHRCWKGLKTEANRNESWDLMGFWRSGDQYETAIRLLLSEAARSELKKLLASHVDRLSLLKTLDVPKTVALENSFSGQ